MIVIQHNTGSRLMNDDLLSVNTTTNTATLDKSHNPGSGTLSKQKLQSNTTSITKFQHSHHTNQLEVIASNKMSQSSSSTLRDEQQILHQQMQQQKNIELNSDSLSSSISSWNEISNTNIISDSEDDFFYCIEVDDNILPAGEDNGESVIQASACAGAAIGLLLGGGCVAAAAAGLGCSYAAAQKEDVCGDIARAMGEMALTAKEKAVEMDQTYRIVQTTKDCARDMNHTYRIVQTTKDCARSYYNHPLVEQTKRYCNTSFQRLLEDNKRNNNALITTTNTKQRNDCFVINASAQEVCC